MGVSETTSIVRTTTFAQVATLPAGPGVYEIHTRRGVALKVGIAGNLRRRLYQHGRSRQNRLLLCAGGSWKNPAHVTSKQSILAKHLFFDGSLTRKYDLRTETGRQAFVERECIIRFVSTLSRDAARIVEVKRERTGKYRYLGKTRVR